LRRTYFRRKVKEIRPGVSLNVKLDSNDPCDIPHITGSNMSLILSGMDGYPLATCLDADSCSLDHVGFITASGITQRSDFVDVDTKIDHVSFPLVFFDFLCKTAIACQDEFDFLRIHNN
jgi:hypothetical protein